MFSSTGAQVVLSSQSNPGVVDREALCTGHPSAPSLCTILPPVFPYAPSTRILFFEVDFALFITLIFFIQSYARWSGKNRTNPTAAHFTICGKFSTTSRDCLMNSRGEIEQIRQPLTLRSAENSRPLHGIA